MEEKKDVADRLLEFDQNKHIPQKFKKPKRDIEITPKILAGIIFFAFIFIVGLSVGISYILKDLGTEMVCNYPDQICDCPNVTIPENLCNGVTVQAPAINLTYQITNPTCVLQGCNETELMGNFLSRGVDFTLKIRDSNGTIIQQNLMNYYGNGIYKQIYDNKTIEIDAGD